MKLSSLQQNVNLETEGVWVDYDSEFKVKVARMGNPNFEAYVNKMTKTFLGDGFSRGSEKIQDPQVLQEITQKAMAKTVLLDWAGLEDDEGNQIPYSPEKAYELLSDPKFKDFYRDITQIANNGKRYRDEGVEEAVGNSQTT